MTLSYDAGTFTLETREGTFEFVGRDIVSIEGRAKKTIVKLSKAGMPHMLRLAASNGFTYASTLEGYRQDSIAIDISGGGGTTDLFTNTTASEFVKTNATNDGLESFNLFGGTTASQAVQVNATNDELEGMLLKYDDTKKSLFIGNPVSQSAALTGSRIIAIGDNGNGDNVFNTSLDSYNDTIAINSIPLKRSKYVSIGNGANLGFISNGGRVTLRRVMALTTDTGTDIRNLVERGFKATTDSAKTITINNYILNTIQNIAGSVDLTYTEWIGAQLDFIIDNTIATGTNHITIALSATGLSVNGTDSLVVNAGTVGKFAVIVTNPIVGDTGTAKICRVF